MATAYDRIPTTDRGFQFGDGLFETIAVKAGQLRLWPAHRARLEAGLQQLRLSPARLDWQALEAAIMAAAASHEGALKLIVTAGDGAQGYRRSASPLRWSVTAREVPQRPTDWWSNGVCLRVCETRLGKNPVLAGIKHLNRLEQVLARSEWDDPAIADGVMLDTGGGVVSTTMANLFLVDDEVLSTPDLAQCGIQGVMKARVIEEAKALGLAVQERAISLEQLLEANEVFMTNALIGLWPVRRIDDRVITAGPIAASLLGRIAVDALVPKLWPEL